MDEPYRSRFIELVRRGAASRDMHDTDGRGSYDSEGGSVVSERFIEREVRRAQQHAGSLCLPLADRLGSASIILDVGCGTGGTTVALALSSLAPRETTGIDVSMAAIRAARVRAQGHGIDPGRVRFMHVAAGHPLPFADGYFDLVTCVSVLEFIGDPSSREALVAEMLRVARPGGYLYIATPSPIRLHDLHSHRWLGDWRRDPGYPWSSTGASLRRMLGDCRVESLAPRRVRLHPRLKRVAWAVPAISWALPWQRLLARKPEAVKH